MPDIQALLDHHLHPQPNTYCPIYRQHWVLYQPSLILRADFDRGVSVTYCVISMPQLQNVHESINSDSTLLKIGLLALWSLWNFVRLVAAIGVVFKYAGEELEECLNLDEKWFRL